LYWDKRKRRRVKLPKARRQITVTEDQGKVVPPNWRPNRNIVVALTMRMLPSQSTALRPARRGVLGVSSLRVEKIEMKAMAVRGTG
jgi:hypothetical protein